MLSSAKNTSLAVPIATNPLDKDTAAAVVAKGDKP